MVGGGDASMVKMDDPASSQISPWLSRETKTFLPFLA